MNSNNLRMRWSPWLAGLCVSLLGLLVSVFLAHQQSASMAQLEAARFAQATTTVTESLLRRIDTYTEIAVGLRGLFIVNPQLDRRAFQLAVLALDIQARFPGVKNIAFTRYVADADKQRFEAQVRADTSLVPQGYPDFAIHPPGQREEYFVADYLWPMPGNESVHGLDISAQGANLASMHYSRRSGEVVASAPFDLMQEPSERVGFVIRVPVFRTPQGVARSTDAAAHFLGSVAVTVRVADLFRALEREGHLQKLRLALSDGGSTIAASPQRVMVPMFASSTAAYGDRVQHRELGVYGRRWQLDFQPTAPFLSESERRAAWMIAGWGALVSLLLGGLVLLLVRDRLHALAHAAASGEALRDSEGRWKFALEGSGDGLWDWNVAQNNLYFSPRWKEMLGYRDDEIGNDFDAWAQRVHPDDYPAAMDAVKDHLAGRTPLYVNEHRMQCKDGTWCWILSRGMVIARDAAGQPQRMIGTHTDITQRKLAAQALQTSLREKEALLMEVHHRVKNNLQVITSLLNLEGRRANHGPAKAVLDDMQGRIRSMALLHESLYRAGTFASVDLGAYLAKLVRQAFHTHGRLAERLELDLQLGSVQVGMDQAIACGLLVNELLSNCLKHAFPGERNGTVGIVLQPVAELRRWCLQVSDDGVGLPPDWEKRRSAALGLQLACDLAGQLGGTLEIGKGAVAGMVCTVRFDAMEPAPLVMPV